jgi:hypothetical protein
LKELRTLGVLILAVALAAGFYVAWPLVGLYQVAQALHSRDAEAFVEHVDLRSLRRSIIRQVLSETSRTSEIEERLGEVGREIVVSIGASALEEQAAAFLTPELIRELFATGTLSEDRDESSSVEWRKFAIPENPLRYVKGWSIREPTRVRIKVGQTDRPEEWAAVMLVFRDAKWKLTEVALPRSVLAEVAPYLRERFENARL